MLLALRSLWETGGVVTGTSAVTAAPGISAATGRIEHPRVGGKRRKLPHRRRRIVQWSEAPRFAPIRRPEPLVIVARAELRAASATSSGYAELGTEADAFERDEAFFMLVLAA